MPAQIIESKTANARFGSLWVGGRVTLTEKVVRFEPNALNGRGRAVEVVRVDLRRVRSVDVRSAMVTKIVTVTGDDGVLSFRCFGADAFAEKIRRAAAASGVS